MQVGRPKKPPNPSLPNQWLAARADCGGSPGKACGAVALTASGRFAKASAKAAIEVGEIAETALIRNGEDPERTRRVGKQSPGTAETMLEHMLAERLARLFQQAADVAWRHPEGLGDQVVVKGRINSPLGDCRENSAQARRLDAARCHLGGAVPGSPENCRDEIDDVEPEAAKQFGRSCSTLAVKAAR